MKFKAPGDEPIMIGLTSGHTLVIKPEGTDVEPRFRREAIAKGCIPLGAAAEQAQAPKGEPTKAELIAAGIDRMLDHGGEGDFTADGKPDVRALSKVVGFTVTSSERDEAWSAIEDRLKHEPE